MGFTSTIKKAATKLADSVGQGSGLRPSGFQPKEDPYLRSLTDRTKGIADEQQRQYEEFNKRAPELKDQRFNITSDSMKKQLATDMVDNTRTHNRRGLLFSGIKQGEEGKLQTKLGSDLVGAKGQISEDVDAQGKEMQAASMQAAFQAAQADQMLKNDMYRQALQAREEYLGGMSPIMGAFQRSGTAYGM